MIQRILLVIIGNFIFFSEMKNFSVFKRYETGERASRLYLKNLVAKVTSEQVMERKTININDYVCLNK